MHQGITKPIGDLFSSASGDAAAVAQQIRKQEAELTLPRVDEQTALEIETQIRSLYTSTLLAGQPDKAKHQGIAFAVELFGGMRLAAGTIGPGVTPGNWTWIERKINTVRLHHKSSFLTGRELVTKGRDINSLGPDFAAHGGAFPIRVTSCTYPIGAVAVSGLAQEVDHWLVTQALCNVIDGQKA
ncbi:hypothetical protein FA10DRAFT_268052 [Acaromyces ingoldii]|uniref:Heme-degrading domain-containing protein n=1 Tax=Acaromyces ingoldii TaxID=215250 RepID=A0A316YJY7_9BASI|nr:hypothetical protein FA10DRAFT_268052 [Acaromyces ingoldii]PWN89511.1 hypothetical protein FA10DRAFT_268052 [Acaromyces ingoldii]